MQNLLREFEELESRNKVPLLGTPTLTMIPATCKTNELAHGMLGMESKKLYQRDKGEYPLPSLESGATDLLHHFHRMDKDM